MKIKSPVALLSVVALSVLGYIGVTSQADGNESASTVLPTDGAELTTQNQCTSEIDSDYMELLENSNEKSVLFVGCGGLL